ncbi:CapA family protein [Patescibacteria group bacterium]
MFTVDVNQKMESEKTPKRSSAPTLLFIVIFFSLITYFYVTKKNSDDNQTSSGADLQIIEATQSKYYLVQKEFKTHENSVSMSELSEGEVACFEEDSENIKTLLEIDSVNIINSDSAYEWMKTNSYSSYLIIPPEKSDVRLKTLAVDDMYIWDKGIDLSKYPLVVQEEVQVASNEVDSFGASNFDHSSVLTYVAGGEVVPSRAVARKFLRTEDYKFPFYDVEELFLESDVSSLMLENSMDGTPTPCHGCTWFEGDEKFMEGLEFIDVDVISPGNHFRDGGDDSVARTIELLNEAGIHYSGFSSTNWDDASEPAVTEIDGFKIAYLGYDDVGWFHWAGPTWGGVATVSTRAESGAKNLLVDRIKNDVERATAVSDYVIVLMSWGDIQYINKPLEYQRQMGQAFLDAGADLIVGSHQHWVNAVESYEGSLIFYGIGNFVFDLTHTDPTREGVLIKFYFFNKKLVSAKIIPYQACGPQQSLVDDDNCNHFQPRLLEETDPVYRGIMERMFEYTNV